MYDTFMILRHHTQTHTPVWTVNVLFYTPDPSAEGRQSPHVRFKLILERKQQQETKTNLQQHKKLRKQHK